MTMKDSTNHYHCSKQHPDKNRPVNVNPESKTQTGFGLPSAALLLVSTLAVICQSYSITNGTVSNKISNIWSICGPVFKTFISIITKYELITIFEA